MATWGEIIQELQVENARPGRPPGTSAFDAVRRKYLAALAAHTKRNVILYASAWTVPGAPAEFVSITPEDVHGFMEVIHGLPAAGLDLILHSPGGSAEVTESLVAYLRSKFTDIRVIVPHAAMSAATMLACSANQIVMGKHSFLGPIDPQFILQTENGKIAAPAFAILKQFEMAQEQCKGDPSLLPSWLPILRQYGPALLVQCKYQSELAESLVADWLARYMFHGESDAAAKAAKVAESLNDHHDFKSHSRFISRSQARDIGLVVDELETDQKLQDLVLSVFHAVNHTFGGTQAVKIVENHLGKAFLKLKQEQLIIQAGPGQPQRTLLVPPLVPA